jgi:hypothetical protein
MNANEKKAWIASQNDEADFIWNHFFNYCKSFYAKGGVYGDEVDASDHEIENAILDVLDRFDHEFEGDSYDRELVRHYIETNRKNKLETQIMDNFANGYTMTNYYLFKAMYQMMAYDLCLEGEQNGKHI